MAHTTLFQLDADLITLRALVAVVDEGNFTAAGKRIGRTQSAVSLQIAKLEERTNARLLERTSRSVTVTAMGEVFTAYARRILDLADEALMAVSAPAASEPLRVGFAEYLAPKHLHTLLARFKRAHPQLALELQLGSGNQLIQALRQQALDIVIAGPESDGGRRLLEEPLVWVGGREYTPDTNDSIPLILMKPPCSYRQAAFDALTQEGLPWAITLEANSIQGVQSAVAAGLGVSVLARSATTDDMIPLHNRLPALPSTSMEAYQPPHSSHPLADRFIRYIEEGLASRAT